MAQFIFEGRGKDQRTGHEKIAMRNIRYAINWIVGGFYNDYQDGNEEYIPDTIKDLEEIIYDESMQNGYGDGFEHSGRAPKEMRFAGEKFCREYIAWKLRKDDDAKELAEVKGWEI
ncbi:MAG: hypothetical protein J6S14_07255 [Clostridia bacterium]|nr:hypothetical protein [Clostridia bacterium]